jgi:PPP family 3-phenylpropionic acid transporter
MRLKAPFTIVSLNYFAYFMILAAWQPFIVIYLQQAGWTGFLIGLFSAIGPLLAFLTQPLWGLVSDAWGNVRLLYVILVAATAGFVLIFGFFPVSQAFFALAVLMGLTQGPLTAMLDSMAVQTLQKNSNRIGQARLWGSLSFATLALIMGAIFEKHSTAIFPGFVLASAFAALVGAISPAEGSTLNRPDFRLSSIKHAINRPFLFFLGCAFLLQMGLSLTMPFLSLVLLERGASSSVVGYTWGFTALVEIPIFAVTAKLLRRRRPEQLIVTAGVINTLRMLLFAFTPNPWLLVAIHAMEGLAFPLITVSVVLLVDELVEPAFKTTGFTLQAACAYTLPRFLGSIWGGRIMDLFGGTGLFLLGAASTALGTAAMALWRAKFGTPSQSLDQLQLSK